MLATYIEETLASAPGTGDVTLPNAGGRTMGSFADAFGTSRPRYCWYFIEDTSATLAEWGIGRFNYSAGAYSAGKLTRSVVKGTFNAGTWTEIAPSAQNFTGTSSVKVRITPISESEALSFISSSGDNCIVPDNLTFTAAGSNQSQTNGQARFVFVELVAPWPVKSLVMGVQAALTGPTTQSIAAKLFEVGSDGFAGNVVHDFGSNTSNGLTTTGALVLTGSQADYAPPGDYWLGILPSWTGSPTGAFALRSGIYFGATPYGEVTNNVGGRAAYTVNGGDLNDPPTSTSAVWQTTNAQPGFGFRPT